MKHDSQLSSLVENISPEDYFLKSSEFRVWLLKEVYIYVGKLCSVPAAHPPLQRKIYFNDLSSEQSRQLFKKFVSKWNNGLLNRASHDLLHVSLLISQLPPPPPPPPPPPLTAEVLPGHPKLCCGTRVTEPVQVEGRQ